jgi:hypothetical protein
MKPQNDLERNIARLADAVEKQNAMPRRFLLGIVSGIGTAIGATAIAGIVLVWLVKFLQSLGLDQFIQH